ncbi:hypothetical protein BDV18DRAFT_139285 [Aspergillus unguis]
MKPLLLSRSLTKPLLLSRSPMKPLRLSRSLTKPLLPSRTPMKPLLLFRSPIGLLPPLKALMPQLLQLRSPTNPTLNPKFLILRAHQLQNRMSPVPLFKSLMHQVLRHLRLPPLAQSFHPVSLRRARLSSRQHRPPQKLLQALQPTRRPDLTSPPRRAIMKRRRHLLAPCPLTSLTLVTS